MQPPANTSNSAGIAGADTPPTMTRAGFRRGAVLALPFCVSSVVYGLAFGLLATGVGLSTIEAVAMSALVFSGTAQVAVVQAWGGQPSLLVVFVTVLVANIRYVLVGAALRPWLAPLGTLRASLALLPLVDASFAMASRARADGDNDAGLLVGSAMISYTGWVVGTGLGTLAGQVIPNPRVWGLDFIIVAFCAASAALLVRTRGDIWPALAAIAAVVTCEYYAPGPWTVVAAGLAGAGVGAALYRAPAHSAQVDASNSA
jgi:predicted branched-subunit amino acid permease